MLKKNNSLMKYLNRRSTAGFICVLPFTIGFILFLAVPMGLSLYYSFCDYNILSPPKLSGIGNYVKMFTSDRTFWRSVKATLYFAFASVPLRLVFALIVALILMKKTKLTGFYRAVYYMPSIMGGSVAIAILWKRMFAIDGVVNTLLNSIGFNIHFNWVGNVGTAIWTLILLSVWQFGSSMLIFLASMKQISGELYEAAEVDGASGPKKFFRITLPLLTPTIFFNLIIQTIGGLLAFTQCLIITQGKPMDSTLFYALYMYQQTFTFNRAGYGSAMAWVMLTFISLFTLILFGTKRFWVFDPNR